MNISLIRLALSLLLFAALPAVALDPGFPYQGRLYTNGVAATGVFDLQFQLFNAASGGVALRTATVADQSVTNGFFNTRVDFGASVFDGTDFWMEVAVREGTSTGAFELLGARRPLLAVPHALHAATAGNLTGNAAAQVAAVQSALVATNNALAAAVVAATNSAIANLLAGANTFTSSQTINGTLAAGALGGLAGAALDVQVDGARALRLEPTGISPNVVAGHGSNTVTNGNFGAAVAGGGSGAKPQRIGGNYAFIGGGEGNTSRADYAAVSGGQNNVAAGDSAVVGGGDGNTSSGAYSTVTGGAANVASGLLATIGGGQENTASANFAAVLGGNQNTAAGTYSAVLGGDANTASGSYALAAGRRAQATNNGAILFADSVNADFGSSRTNEFAARATGGVRFVSGVNASGTPVAGVTLAPLATSWSVLSDRESKKDFAPVDTRAVLEKLAGVPVQAWHYRWEEAQAAPHLGPVAQDFKAAFFPGRDDRSITTLEFDGVALAAIQGLNQKLEMELKAKDAELAELRRSLGQLHRLVEQLQTSQKNGGTP
jgi:hypothetical protein